MMELLGKIDGSSVESSSVSSILCDQAILEKNLQMKDAEKLYKVELKSLGKARFRFWKIEKRKKNFFAADERGRKCCSYQ